MENAQVFVPKLLDAYKWMSLCFVLGFAGLVVAVASFRNAQFPARPAAQLVGPLFAIVGLAGGAMVLWDIARTPTVIVAPEYILMGNDTLAIADIDEAYIESVAKGQVVGEQESRDLGIVRLRDGEALLFAQDNYKVKELIGAIRGVLPE